MMKNLIALGSAMILSAFLYTGCSDSVVDPSTTSVTTSSDPYSLLKVNDAEVNDFSEVPTFAEVCPPDSSDDSMGEHRGGPHGPGHGGPRDSADTNRPHDDGGRGWMQRGEGRDFGRLASLGYRHIFKQLNLTAEQDSLLRIYIQEFHTCAEGDVATYKAARKQAFDSLKASIDEIRAAVDAGTLTRDSAKVQIDALIAAYRAEVQPLNDALKAAVDACRATFDASFEAILTPDQLAIWNAKK